MDIEGRLGASGDRSRKGQLWVIEERVLEETTGIGHLRDKLET